MSRLWEELRQTAARWGPHVPPTSVAELSQRLTVLADSEDHEVVVAELGGDVVGVAVFSEVPVNALTDDRSLQISFMHVRDDRRRKGVGHALVKAAAARAEASQLEFVSVEVFPQARESNRFFAQIGFSPYSVQRAAPAAALRRRLAAGPAGRRRLLLRRRSGGRQSG